METHQPPQALLLHRILIPFLFLGIGIGLCIVFITFKSEPEKQVQIKPQLKVSVFKSEMKDEVVYVNGYGRIEPWRKTRVSSEVRAKIEKVSEQLKEGQMVSANVMLLVLDHREFKLEKERSELEAKRLNQEKELLLVNQKTDRQLIKLREESVKLLEKEDRSNRKLNRDSNIVSKMEMDRTRRNLLKEKEGLLELRRRLQQYGKNLIELEQRRKIIEAQIQLADLKIQQSIIYSPYSGRISQLRVHQGQFASPGDPLFTISDESQLEVKIPLLISDTLSFLPVEKTDVWYRFKKPVQAKLRWTEETDFMIGAKCRRIAQPDMNNDMLHMVLEDINPSSGLKSGMFVEAQIQGKSFAQVVKVPDEAISGQNTLFVAEPNESGYYLKTKKVEWIFRNSDYALTKEGKSGELLVTTPIPQALEGTELLIDSDNQK